MKPTRPALVPVILLVLAILAAWFFRPWLHGLVMSWYINPIWLALAASLLAAAIYYGRFLYRASLPQAKPQAKRLPVLGYLIPVGLVALGIGSLLANELRYLSGASAIAYQSTEQLPRMEQSRLVPLAVAERFGVDSLQRSTERAYDWNPQLWDGTFSWVSALTPEGPYRRLFAQAPGIQVIDATATNRSVRTVEQEQAVSLGVGITDNIRWKLYKERYFVDVPEVYFGKVGDEVVAVAPKLAFRGLLVKYPVPDGVFVVYPDGRIEDVKPADAATHPAVVSSGRLVPESYARFAHEAYAYKRGLVNKWFAHVDQPEITDPSGEANAQPYLLDTDAGLAWISAATPWGKSAGIYKLFVTDATTGRTTYYDAPADTPLTGADQALGYVRSARPQYNWRVPGEDGAGSGNIVALEPRPQVIQDALYWMVSVTSSDAKGVQETCFVNAGDNEVTCTPDDATTTAFIRGGETALPAPDQPVTGTTGDGARLDRLQQLLEDAQTELERLRQAQ